MPLASYYPGLYPSSMVLGPAAEKRREQVVARPVEAVSTRRAVLVGTTDPHVRSLLTDVLRDIHVEVELADEVAEGSTAHAVLAMVERVEGVAVIGEARARWAAPVIAILPLGTHRLATRAIAAGAQACYLFDMPIDRLRGLLSALLDVSPPVDKRKAARPPAR